VVVVSGVNFQVIVGLFEGLVLLAQVLNDHVKLLEFTRKFGQSEIG
jgi:hypothetical protein